jgi:hypothetical protein
MPLPTFKTLEEIPEAFRSEYVQRDGEYVPNVEDVAPLKSAHERQKEENRQLKAKLAEREAAERLKAETDKAKQQGVTDEQLAKIRAEIAAEKAPLEDANTKLQAEIRSLKLDSRIKALMGEAGFNPKRVDDLYKLIGDRFDLNDSGTPILKDNPAADLLKTLKSVADKEYPEFALSPQKGGTQAAGGGGGTTATADQEKMLVSNPMALLAQANTKTA